MDEGTATIPAAGQRIIERPRLTKILDESNARIILLIAPAGYGKTTLARQWLRDKPHVWYQATAASADPVALARGLFSAAGEETVALDGAIRANPAFAGDAEALSDAVASALPRGWNRWLVVDDYQFIAQSGVAEDCVAAMLRRGFSRVIVASRTTPSWLSARDLVYGDTKELGTDELRMTESETAAVLRLYGVSARGLSRTHGWPALVRLAAAASHSAVPPEATPDVTFRFFAEELLRDVPTDFETWLVDCAVAPSLMRTGSSAFARDAVARGFMTEEAGQLAMHPLLRDFLKRRLRESPNSRARTRTLVARLAEAGQREETFDAILEFGLLELLEAFLREQTPALLRAGLFETARLWRERVRAQGYSGPVLDLIEGDQLERKGSLRKAHELALSVVSRVSDDDPLRVPALLLAGRTAYMEDDLIAAAKLYRCASDLATSTADDVDALWGALTSLVELEHPDAPATLAELKRIQCPDDASSRLRIALAEMYFSSYVGNVGEGLRAASAAEQLLPLVRDGRVASSFLSMYSLLLVFAGSYSAAERYSVAAHRRAESARLQFAYPHIDVRRALARLGLGDCTGAVDLATRAATQARVSGAAYLETIATTTHAKALIALGLAAEATELPQPTPGTAAGFIAERLAVQAVGTATAGNPRAAMKLAERAEELTHSHPTRVSAACARAIAGTNSTNPVEALLRTIRVSGNFDAAVFAVRGCAQFADRLQEHHAAPDLDDVRHRLVRIASLPHQVRASRDATLPHSLSPREREVLALLSQGLTNKAIASALFISHVTVKVHLRHIYEKLGVRSRVAAVIAARDLDLGTGPQ